MNIAGRRYDDLQKFPPNGPIPDRLTWRDVEALTGQRVIDMFQFNKHWIRLVLENGWRFNIKKW